MTIRVFSLGLLLALPMIAASQTPVVPPIDPGASDSDVTNSAPPAAPPAPMDRTPSPTGTSSAVAVGAQQHFTPPPPVNLLSGKDATLTGAEKQSLGMSNQWMNSPAPPAEGDAGAIVFQFGATLPSVVCSPLHICDIALQPGEVINDINCGDQVRWKIGPAVTGSGSNKTTHVIIKPTDTALMTNLNIATDRRTYVIKLVSRRDDWMPLVSFAYPEDLQAQWAAYHDAQAKHDEATVLPTGENVSQLDFGYHISGDKVDWRPLRVYTNGAKTYVQFPKTVAYGDLPTLVSLGSDDKETLVNYRKVGDRFEVDKFLRRAALIRGVGGDQERVDIVYDGRQ